MDETRLPDRAFLARIVQSAFYAYGVFEPTREDIDDVIQDIYLGIIRGENARYYYMAMHAIRRNRSIRAIALSGGEETETETEFIRGGRAVFDKEKLRPFLARKTMGRRGENYIRLQETLLETLSDGVPLPRAAERCGITYNYAKQIVRRIKRNVERMNAHEMFYSIV